MDDWCWPEGLFDEQVRAVVDPVLFVSGLPDRGSLAVVGLSTPLADLGTGRQDAGGQLGAAHDEVGQ